MTYTIENEQLICIIDSHGSEIKSVKDKKYRYEGKTYEMGQHGFARDMEFTLLGRLDDEIWMELTDTEETLSKYPFKFRLKIGYQLNGRDLTVAWRVENLNEKEMPFAIGAHPGFMIPRDKNHVFRLYDRQGNLVDSIENRIFGTGGCITDRTEVINTPEGVLPITNHLFDGDALVIENEQLGAVELVKDGMDTPEISVRFSSPLVGLWSPPKKNAPFVCIEPWYGRCDSEGFTGDLRERDHEQILKPGSEFQAEYNIMLGGI